MQLQLDVYPCSQGTILPLLPCQENAPCRAHRGEVRAHSLPVGTILTATDNDAELQVCGHTRLPMSPHAQEAPLLCARTDLTQTPRSQVFSLTKKGYSLAWITLSDKGARGEREDTSGPALAARIAEVLPICFSQGYLLPDEPSALRSLLTSCALLHQFDLICTSGGTGLTARDRTPEATERVLDAHLPGFVVAMMTKSLEKTPRAVLSRACAGVLGTSLIINFPGSRKAALENLEAVLPALEHTLAKLHNDPSDCGG